MAADDPRVTVEGADRAAETLAKAGRMLGDLSEQNRKAAEIFVAVARSRAPRLTGALAAATMPASDKENAGFTNPLPYFGPIHYGWPDHNIAANPFVDQAVDETERDWFEVYDQATADAVGQVKGA